jgi:hypothetical protein
MTDEKPLYVTDPEKWLKELTTSNDFVGIVLFRGSWCKYDKYYLQKLGKFNMEKMKPDGLNKLIAWTSEGVEGATKANEAWGLTKDFGYDVVLGDDTNALAKYLVEDCILEHIVTMSPEDAKLTDQITPGTYPNGIVMPGMIWYAHHGSLVLQWEAKVEEPDFGGPTRPTPQGTMRHVCAKVPSRIYWRENQRIDSRGNHGYNIFSHFSSSFCVRRLGLFLGG